MEFVKPVLKPNAKRTRYRFGDLQSAGNNVGKARGADPDFVALATHIVEGAAPSAAALDRIAAKPVAYVEGPDAAPEPPPGASPGVYGARQRTRSAIGKASSAKGASGEREVLAALRAVMEDVEAELRDDGYSFVPRSEFCNRRRLEKGKSREDISGIPLISIEVKRNENLNVGKAWEQALSQATERRLPVLVYKFNREPWRVRTWLAFTTPYGSITAYTAGETTLPEFLSYFRHIYRGFLAEGLR